MALGSNQPVTEMNTRNISCGVKVAGAYGWQIYNFMCLLSWNLGALNSCKPQSVSRTLQGMLYLSSYSLTHQDVLFSSTKAVTHHINLRIEHYTIQCESILFICPFVRIHKKLGSESADLPTYLTCIYT